MKKVLYLFITIISIFYGSFVFAKDYTGAIHTNNSTRNYKYSLNLFQETKEKTGLSKFLYSRGSNLMNDLISLSSHSLVNKDFAISLMTYYDFEHYFSNLILFNDYSNYSYNYDDYIIDDSYRFNLFSFIFNNDIDDFIYNNNSGKFSISVDTEYFDDYNKDSVFYVIILSQKGRFNVTSYDSTLYLKPYSFIFVNRSGDVIGRSNLNCGDNKCNSNVNDSEYYDSHYGLYFKFFFKNLDHYGDMTSWYGYIFKDINIFAPDFDKIYPEYFMLDGQNDFVRVNNNAGYSGVSGFFKNIFSDYYKDIANYNMRFVYTSIFYSKKSGTNNLYDIWMTDSSAIIPDNFTSIDISLDEKGYYLVPKKSDLCSVDDYYLYYSGSSNLSVNGIKFNYYLYNNSSNSFQITKKLGYFSSAANVNYFINVLAELDVDIDSFLNYAINVYQDTLNNTYFVYYNPTCYNSYSVNNNEDITLNFSSGDYLLTWSKILYNFEHDTVNGSNYEWGSTKPGQHSSNPNVANAGTLSGEIKEPGFGFSDIVSNIGSFATSFISDITALVGITTTFLTGLPPEIYYSLISIFYIGLVILVIKLFL